MTDPVTPHAPAQAPSPAIRFYGDEVVECELTAAEAVRESLKRHGHVCSEVGLRRLSLDAGGMISLNEPNVEVEASGVTFHGPLRQAPYFVEFFETYDASKNKRVPGMVWWERFPGVRVFVTPATARALAEALKKEIAARSGEIEEWEKKRIEVIEKAGVVDGQTCHCGSGKLRKECHGRNA